MMSTHLAAISPSKGQPFDTETRPTPKPGPGELLVAVKSIALNPADGYMRNLGLFIPSYPTVIGFDISGLVIEIGEDVPTGSANDTQSLSFEPGITRVAAYAASYWRLYKPDYGAFQERCIVPWQHAVPILDENMSWNHAATLPVAAEVPLSAWDAMEIPRIWGLAIPTSAPQFPNSTSKMEGLEKINKRKDEALLIWGASSSVGTMGVQSARLMKEHQSSPFAAVYATAGLVNTSYVKLLGADRVFDYSDSGVVDAIISAAKKDGLVIRHCFLAMGQLALCQAVLKSFLGDEKEGEKKQAKIGSAPIVPPDADVMSGVETIFLQPSSKEEERLGQFQYWMGSWLRENLAKGVIRPSPEPRVVGKGLAAINTGLDLLLQGVSCTKLVIELDQ
ncbi:chaperonin 10-like protein [Pyrenochaeta sp. MPI-SDFR-AT-0127]|nr:chaperonin 10-like protein [Pyrenochaeta sp. MPI-SDFR-AT-0127]